MKDYKKLLIINSSLIIISIIICISCNNTNEENDDTLENNYQSDNTSLVKSKIGPDKISKSFEEFLLRKNEIELRLRSTRLNKTFDQEESVELRIELYNPRYLTYQTYKNTLGAGQPEPEFSNRIVGTNANPWHENLRLFHVSENKEIPLTFAAKYPSEQNELNIGQGDIGSVGIILQPNIFPSEGEFRLKFKYVEPEKDIELTAMTSIMLKKDQADEQQIKLSNIYYHIAIDEMEEALKLSLESVQAWPESYHANVLLGEIYEENGQLEEALTAYQQGILLFKNDQEDRIVEFPKGLWDKINELEEKLK